ncbi:tRNA-dihydrouridine synthase family protein, partial [Candidatus Micrarchaeota archaeon]|nr:tRNA-dihydrouridine synthase family protein [Candidatus Micrarchaeota archaeon]
PEILQEATTMVAKQADVIDLNLGCPVQKAERQGVGAVLLQKPDLVEKLVHAMRTVTEKPITAKMRLVKSIPKSVALAKCIERGGVNAITVHGRTKTQKRKGMIDFEAVKAIKESVAIPVINNGGVQNQNSLVEIQEKTGCDGFMLARSAIGNPGIFAEVQGKQGISKEKALKRYLELCTELNFRHFGRIKQQCLRFGHALNNKSLSRAMEKVRSSKELEKITSTF